jgi:hypothetical protein
MNIAISYFWVQGNKVGVSDLYLHKFRTSFLSQASGQRQILAGEPQLFVVQQQQEQSAASVDTPQHAARAGGQLAILLDRRPLPAARLALREQEPASEAVHALPAAATSTAAVPKGRFASRLIQSAVHPQSVPAAALERHQGQGWLPGDAGDVGAAVSSRQRPQRQVHPGRWLDAKSAECVPSGICKSQGWCFF